MKEFLTRVAATFFHPPAQAGVIRNEANKSAVRRESCSFLQGFRAYGARVPFDTRSPGLRRGLEECRRYAAKTIHSHVLMRWATFFRASGARRLSSL